MKRHSGSARERPTARQLPEMTGRVSTCMFSPLRLGLPPAELYGGTCLCTGMGEVRKFVDRKGFAGRPRLCMQRVEKLAAHLLKSPPVATMSRPPITSHVLDTGTGSRAHPLHCLLPLAFRARAPRLPSLRTARLCQG